MVRECQNGNGTFENAKDIEAKSSLRCYLVAADDGGDHFFPHLRYAYISLPYTLEGSPGSLAGGLLLIVDRRCL